MGGEERADALEDAFHSIAQAVAQMQDAMRTMQEQMQRTDEAVRGMAQGLSIQGQIVQSMARRMTTLEHRMNAYAEQEAQLHPLSASASESAPASTPTPAPASVVPSPPAQPSLSETDQVAVAADDAPSSNAYLVPPSFPSQNRGSAVPRSVSSPICYKHIEFKH